ncbi:MAG: DUF362 domain-containing protein [Oscillospiraceae bacterium]
MSKSFVILKDAPKMNYLNDFVALPSYYGTNDYFNRADIKAIRETVFSALDELNSRTHFTDELKGNRRVLIKPNLVYVYHNAGYKEKDYPETTDPRVFEAVVAYIKQYTYNIAIIESSGKPFPAAASFKIAGYDKIAKYYKTELIALERQPVLRYMLPKAEVMKEVFLPEILDEVVRGDSYYISVPKMKTNLYTGVTLGFKNAMGTIPYFLRERNHTYLINKKLTDLLYLFKPNLTVIDGIIGGEGNTPAPVDPVEVGMIVASNQSVEADRLTTYMMGFDPAKNKLICEADARGFNDPDVEIVGTPRVTPFRPAIASVMVDEFHNKFPNVLALAGHTLNDAPKITDKDSVTPEIALKLEQACTGGCLSSICMGFDCNNYAPSPKYDMAVAIIIGSGVVIDGEKYWFDRNGKPYTKQDIINLPQKKMAMGKCTGQDMIDIATYKIKGCCDPAECLSATSNACGIVTPQLNPFRNTSLVSIAVPEMLGTVRHKAAWILKGRYVDCPRAHEDKIYGIPPLSDEDMQKDYIPWPLPTLAGKEKKQALLDQLNLLDSVGGIVKTIDYYR